jgi:hypothetical protein
MEFITKKHMSRRTVLRGLGVTMALPWLEAMTPAATVFARAAGRKVRLSAIEMVRPGRCRRSPRRQSRRLAPARSSLEPFRDYLHSATTSATLAA